MSNSADRARYFLEQSVPELQELLRKKILSKDELRTITKKRSDYEHILGARGSQASDYSSYIAYEQNLETLKRKRISRLRVKNTGYNGQRRILFLFERAVRKYPGELGLWLDYLQYLSSIKATKRFGNVLTNVLRLHPASADLWIVAAKYAITSQSDYPAARSYFQRGLRFCRHNKPLWLQYCRLEMLAISKILSHIQDLGHAAGGQASSLQANDNDSALHSMAGTPALTGAIPIAIFEAAMSEFNGDAAFGEQFFDLISLFHNLPCCVVILEHISSMMSQQVPLTPIATLCSIRLPLVGIATTSSKFPMAMRTTLRLLREAMIQHPQVEMRQAVSRGVTIFLLPFATNSTIDGDVRKVLGNILGHAVEISGGTQTAQLVRQLRDDNKACEAEYLLKLGLKSNASHKLLQAELSQSKRNENQPGASDSIVSAGLSSVQDILPDLTYSFLTRDFCNNEVSPDETTKASERLA